LRLDQVVFLEQIEVFFTNIPKAISRIAISDIVMIWVSLKSDIQEGTRQPLPSR
jgi:hypothetical protein